MRLSTLRPSTRPATGQPRWPQRLPDSVDLSRSPQATAESTARLTHITWDNLGCLSSQASNWVSGILPVELLDKDS
jgi:hypothetical protein